MVRGQQSRLHRYIFGLGGNDALDRKLDVAADDVRVRWAGLRALASARWAVIDGANAPTPPNQPNNIQRLRSPF